MHGRVLPASLSLSHTHALSLSLFSFCFLQVAAESERKAALAELTCPITCELFIDPVIAADGTTYERSAIEEWMAQPR